MSTKKVSFLLITSLILVVLLIPQVSLAGPPRLTLTTAVVGCGSVNPASGSFKKNAWVLMTATPCAGWSFDHWEANVFVEDATANPTHITMKSDALVTAYFVGGGPTPTPAPTPTSGPTSTPGPTATAGPTATPASSEVLFDDFNYTDPNDHNLSALNWTLRQCTVCGPGYGNFLKNNISFVDGGGGNRLMRLTATTDGTANGTSQAQANLPQKFFEGTYAALVRFTDAPSSGTIDGDEIVETFYSITPLNYPRDPDYSEIDFEYLPNGGWGENNNIMYMTTWETYQEDPWWADNTNTSIRSSFNGWHTLVFVVSGGQVKYYIDGSLKATHGGKYYPETPMEIDFNLWFIVGGLAGGSGSRSYVQDVDWVYHAKDVVLTPAQVDSAIASYRAQGIVRLDTVP